MTIAECKQICLDEISRLKDTIQQYQSSQWHWLREGCEKQVKELENELFILELIRELELSANRGINLPISKKIKSYLKEKDVQSPW